MTPSRSKLARMLRAVSPLVAAASLVACGGKVVVDEPAASSGAGGSSTGSANGGGTAEGGSSSTLMGSSSGPSSDEVACLVHYAEGATVCAGVKNSTPSQEAMLKKHCMSQHGTFSTTCPSASLLGCCVKAIGNTEEFSCFYPKAGVTVQVVKDYCFQMSNTTFTPTPP